MKNMALIIWKCLECGSTAYHKGLCRDCTEYDDDGKIVNPVRRVRMNKDGTVYESVKSVRLPFKSQERFKRGKKLTKKQLAKVNEGINKYIPHQPNQVVLMAESEDEEE